LKAFDEVRRRLSGSCRRIYVFGLGSSTTAVRRFRRRPLLHGRGGDLTEEPRFIIRHVVKKYAEPINGREKTWCCGGSGGLLTEELLPLRIQYAKNWYEEPTAA
jgi:hypothetical protein